MSEEQRSPKDATGLERENLKDPASWKMASDVTTVLEQRLLSALRAKGYPATSVELDPSKLKGGYICDTMRVFIGYGVQRAASDEKGYHGAREEAEARKTDSTAVHLPKSVLERPTSAILKIASPMSNDHDVAMKLRLYEREWHFYEHLSSRVPIRVPQHLGSVKDEATGLITEGVLLEDLEVPGAVLCPKMDDAGVLKTVSHMARHHAQFWNMPELSSGALGIKPHNASWYQPGWGNDVAGYWQTFEKKWRARGPGDSMGPGLPEEAYAIGKAIVDSFAWVQDELSSKPHTFNHGDVKPPNMFMMPGEHPAFIDWQYTAVGKGCQDVVFFLIEGYEIEECRRLEPLVLAHYHASLVHNGILDYSLDDLKRDWQLACMHFPFYVAMWFGTTPDEALVDPSFPRRFVPRAFDAIIRNRAFSILPTRAAVDVSDSAGRKQRNSEEEFETLLLTPLPEDLKECQAALTKAREAMSELRRERDAYKACLDEIKRTVHSI